jgi:hypothetical protein
MGAEITSEALKTFATRFRHPQDALNSVSNSVRDLCNEESWLEYNTESYPEPQVRIRHIFGHHPGIRKILGCASSEPPEWMAPRQITGAPIVPGEPGKENRKAKEIPYCSFEGG